MLESFIGFIGTALDWEYYLLITMGRNMKPVQERYQDKIEEDGYSGNELSELYALYMNRMSRVTHGVKNEPPGLALQEAIDQARKSNDEQTRVPSPTDAVQSVKEAKKKHQLLLEKIQSDEPREVAKYLDKSALVMKNQEIPGWIRIIFSQIIVNGPIHPKTYVEGSGSMRYLTAQCILDGQCILGEGHFTDEELQALDIGIESSEDSDEDSSSQTIMRNSRSGRGGVAGMYSD